MESNLPAQEASEVKQFDKDTNSLDQKSTNAAEADHFFKS